MLSSKQKKNLIRIIISFVLVAALSVVFHFISTAPVWIQLPLFLVPYFIVGFDVLKKALHGIRNRQPFDECFLMAIATIGAIVIGDYREGVAVMLFYQIGELFQSIAVGKSRRNISELMDIRPDTANLLHEDGSITEEDPDDIEIGSIIVVNPGEKVPIDGIIQEGTTTLNTSALTGESVPRDASEGDEVISGCVSISGRIKIKTTKEFGESTVSKILDLVENSSMKKAKSENFISKFARYYTPIVCYGALALAIIPPVIRMIMGMSGNWTDFFIRACTFLVISCPCAVVVSVPLSFFGGIGCASSKGILVKGSNYLEALADTKYIVFDKTGTLTKGVFVVTRVKPAEGFTEKELISFAAHAEHGSSHPIAISIMEEYGRQDEEGFKTLTNDGERLIKDVENIPGYGVSVNYEGKKIFAGSRKLMDKEGIVGYDTHAANNVGEVGTEVHVSVDGRYAGFMLISDVVKPETKDAMTGLKNQGIKTVMLTGDSEKVAGAVAKEIGINEYRAELLPGDKVEEVEKLIDKKKEKEKLAFVGDGINDAPVLSRADIGIAMGAMGSDAAIEAADIVLMDDDPRKISLAMRISRKTLKIVHQNIVFAIGVKILCLILGAFGIANMWIAIFADVGVMVIAVLNATRALRIKS